MIVFASGLMRFRVQQARLLTPDARLESWYRWAVAAAVFVISIPIAMFISPAAAEWSWLLLLLTGRVEGWLTHRFS